VQANRRLHPPALRRGQKPSAAAVTVLQHP
jgi:hypothetical protein